MEHKEEPLDDAKTTGGHTSNGQNNKHSEQIFDAQLTGHIAAALFLYNKHEGAVGNVKRGGINKLDNKMQTKMLNVFNKWNESMCNAGKKRVDSHLGNHK